MLKNFSLHVPAGMTVAFAGSSGAGKSTLLNLLVGFGQPEEGHILIDGIDLSELDLKSYRSQIAVVPQNTILFSGTLRENISYACPEASEKEVMDVIEKVGLSDVVEALPDGWNPILRSTATICPAVSASGSDSAGAYPQPRLIHF